MGNIRFGAIAIISIAIFSLASRGSKKEKESEQKKEGHEKNDSTVVLTKVQMNAVGITVGNIEQKNLTSIIKASGQLAVPPQNKAEVNVLIGGIVQKINVLEGQAVKKGQTLAVLENTDLIKLQQEYLSIKNGFSYIEAEYQRQKELKAADAGTGKVYQQAEANYRTEQSKLLGMKKQLQQLGVGLAAVDKGQITRLVSITAPISGTVGSIHINAGSYVEPAKSLMEIVDNSKIHADLTVYEKDLFKVRDGQSVRFMLTNQSNQEIYGEIYGVNKSFEGETKGIVVHAIIKANKYGLIPGMYVTALIDIGHDLTAAVPVDAIVRAEGKNYIFVQVEDEKDGKMAFRKVEVAPGVTELGFTQITAFEELKPDVKIITKGAFYALSKSQGSAEEE